MEQSAFGVTRTPPDGRCESAPLLLVPTTWADSPLLSPGDNFYRLRPVGGAEATGEPGEVWLNKNQVAALIIE